MAGALNISEILRIGLPLIRQYEGLRLRPYLCTANVPTIGYGSTRYLDGRRVTLRDGKISPQVAEALLKKTILNTYLPAVLALCPGLRDDYQAAAILSFCYNLGEKQLRTSTLRRKNNARDFAAVPKELLKWTRSGGRVTRGLVLRRGSEVKVFKTLDKG